MANKTNHRRKGKERTEKNVRSRSCSGEGRNGRIGASKWKRLSARAERRTGKNIPGPKRFPDPRGTRRLFIRPEIDFG